MNNYYDTFSSIISIPLRKRRYLASLQMKVAMKKIKLKEFNNEKTKLLPKRQECRRYVHKIKAFLTNYYKFL